MAQPFDQGLRQPFTFLHPEGGVGVANAVDGVAHVGGGGLPGLVGVTGLHGLHVIGGLVVAAWAHRDLGRDSVTLQLCARYWHFLLGLWLAMFGLLFGVTPELVNQICGGGP